MSRKKTQERKEKFKRAIIFEMYGFAILAFAIIGLVQPGAVGQALRGVFRFFAGDFEFMIPIGILILGGYVIWKRRWPERWTQRWSGTLLLTLTWLLFVHISLIAQATAHGVFEQGIISFTYEQFVLDINSPTPVALGGGMIGAGLYTVLHFLLAETGTKIVVIFLFMIALMLLSGRSYYDLWKGFAAINVKVLAWMKARRESYKQMMQELKEEEEQKKQQKEQALVEVKSENNTVLEQVEQVQTEQPVQALEPQELTIHDFADVVYQSDKEEEIKKPIKATFATEEATLKEEQSPSPEVQLSPALAISAKEMVMFEEENLDYGLPPFSILKKPLAHVVGGKKNLQSNAAKLEQTLQSFGVQARVTDVHRGPAVTRYEILPDVGVKVSRIVSLTDDIALALAAKGIRIEAPIPGKSAIGIEVPNDDVAMVSLREVLESSQYHESPSKLTIGLGRDISGQPIVAHLNKMPHLLVAGATGSGKSVCINGIITSILYKAKPNEVKLMMIDPKMVELNVYNGIPHLLTPVVTEPRKAAVALKKVVSEMERRYELFAHLGTRDIERYNEIIKRENVQNPEEKKPLLPYIVVIVDELADLMMVAPGDVEDAICRLAQMARAAGIHLIIATQRPSVDVITGVIKANIPSRIAFGVSSQADSRTILDMGGAEKLLGRGDMLFLPVGASKPMRVQGAFVADEEVEAVVKYCIDQQTAQYHEEMNPENNVGQQSEHHDEDELYQQAVELVVQQGSASVSMLQRRFRIGYARAARLIDSMELNGVVGPYEGSKPREVLIEKEEHIS